MKQGKNSALIVVDVQNGFTPGGHLAVAHADQIIPCINRLAQVFENVILTQDWHPADHISFAENHTAKQPFDHIELSYGTQVLYHRIVYKEHMMPNCTLIWIFRRHS